MERGGQAGARRECWEDNPDCLKGFRVELGTLVTWQRLEDQLKISQSLAPEAGSRGKDEFQGGNARASKRLKPVLVSRNLGFRSETLVSGVGHCPLADVERRGSSLLLLAHFHSSLSGLGFRIIFLGSSSDPGNCPVLPRARPGELRSCPS